MQFRSDDQRKAAFAQMRGGMFPRAKTFWARRNPFEHGKEFDQAHKLKRAGGNALIVVPAAIRQRQREASGLLQKAGLTSGLGPNALQLRKGVLRAEMNDRRKALKQLALAGLGTAAVVLPAGYLAARTGVGNRIALKAIHRFRPLGAARSFADFMRGKATGGAENVVVRQASNLQRLVNSKIDRATTRLTGISDIPAELLRQEGQIKSRLLYATGKDKDRLVRELMQNKRAMTEVWTGRGLIDQADDVMKGTLGRFAHRWGIPVTGSMQRPGSKLVMPPHLLPAPHPVTGEGNWEKMLQRHQEVADVWGKVRKTGVGRLGNVEIVTLKSGTLRRRGGRIEVPFLNPRPPEPTVMGLPKAPIKQKSLQRVARQNQDALRGQLTMIDRLDEGSLKTLLRHPALTSAQKDRVVMRINELKKRKVNI